MKNVFLFIFTFTAFTVAFSQTTDSVKLDSIKQEALLTKIKAKSPKQFKKDLSYSYGFMLMDGLKAYNFSASELNAKFFTKGAKDGFNFDAKTLVAVDTFLARRIRSEKPVLIKKEAEQVAYKIGYNSIATLNKELELQASELDLKQLKKGYTANLTGKKPSFDIKEMQQMISFFFQPKQIAKQEKIIAEQKLEAANNLEKGNAFLKENAKKSGIVVTESGLQYKVIKEGTGEQAKTNSSVKVHYTGTFIDGKVFDSSVERGQPASFSLNNVIKGWQEAISLMRVGARHMIYVPTALAYGEKAPAGIPQNAVLIFDVELLEVSEFTEEDLVKMSYAYGYFAGGSIAKVSLDSAETDTRQFLTGFMMGFKGDEKAFKIAQDVLNARLDTSKVETTSSIDDKTLVAQSLGFTSSFVMAKNLSVALDDFNRQALAVGYTDALNGADAQVKKEEMQAALDKYFTPKEKAAQEAEQAKIAILAKESLAKGEIFRKENAKKADVKQTESGLQYEVLRKGYGPKALAENIVKVHYHGTLIDGTVFDSSIDRGEPVSFPLKNVIKGWQEAVQLMNEGAKFRIVLPAALAYGNNPVGNIPPGSTLIFEVELIEIEK